jgi:hypothetical protein
VSTVVFWKAPGQVLPNESHAGMTYPDNQVLPCHCAAGREDTLGDLDCCNATRRLSRLAKITVKSLPEGSKCSMAWLVHPNVVDEDMSLKVCWRVFPPRVLPNVDPQCVKPPALFCHTSLRERNGVISGLGQQLPSAQLHAYFDSHA